MGVLDDLKSELEEKQRAEQKKDVELTSQQAVYDQQLKPVMLAAYRYFSELVNTLNAVTPELYPVYPINPLASDGLALRQDDYQFDYDHGKHPHQLEVRCSCHLDNATEFHLPDQALSRRYARLLDSYRFAYQRRDQRDERHNVSSSHFVLEGPMQVYIQIRASTVHSCVYIDLCNLEDQPERSYKYSPENVNDELFDSIAQLLVRQDTQLVSATISDQARQKLRQQLELEKRLREEHQAGLDAGNEESAAGSAILDVKSGSNPVSRHAKSIISRLAAKFR